MSQKGVFNLALPRDRQILLGLVFLGAVLYFLPRRPHNGGDDGGGDSGGGSGGGRPKYSSYTDWPQPPSNLSDKNQLLWTQCTMIFAQAFNYGKGTSPLLDVYNTMNTFHVSLKDANERLTSIAVMYSVTYKILLQNGMLSSEEKGWSSTVEFDKV